MKESKYTIIISGGRIDDAFATSFVKESHCDNILAADSGMEFLKRTGIKPQIIIGDFDSVKQETLDYFRKQENIEFSQLNPIKDDTDTEYAIRYAISQGATKITVLGGTGTRLDHVYGNISLMGIGLEENVELELLDEHNRIRMIDSSLTITKKEQFGKFFSLFPFGDQTRGVTVKGAKYPLSMATLSGFNSLGVSNEIIADQMEITIEEGYLIVMETRD